MVHVSTIPLLSVLLLANASFARLDRQTHHSARSHLARRGAAPVAPLYYSSDSTSAVVDIPAQKEEVAASEGVPVATFGFAVESWPALVTRSEDVEERAAGLEERSEKKKPKKKAKKAKKSKKKAKKTKAKTTTTGKGLIGFKSKNCGPSGATAEQPNGSAAFLACGISKSHKNSGWKVPEGVTMADIKTVSLADAMASNSVWEPCKPYLSLFEKHAKSNGLPAILLASFALQESTCSASESGDNGGAIGLMQITEDKCGGKSTKACASPDYNIATGAAYFKSQLDYAGGNFLQALGAYNGWFPDMTYAEATAAMYTGCCECQQNLDYLYQFVNGWAIGKTGYSLGTFKNLDACANQS